MPKSPRPDNTYLHHWFNPESDKNTSIRYAGGVSRRGSFIRVRLRRIDRATIDTIARRSQSICQRSVPIEIHRISMSVRQRGHATCWRYDMSFSRVVSHMLTVSDHGTVNINRPCDLLHPGSSIGNCPGTIYLLPTRIGCIQSNTGVDLQNRPL